MKEIEIEVPKNLTTKEFRKAEYRGVFLVFLTGRSQKHIEKKIKQIKKLVEIIKIT